MSPNVFFEEEGVYPSPSSSSKNKFWLPNASSSTRTMSANSDQDITSKLLYEQSKMHSEIINKLEKRLGEAESIIENVEKNISEIKQESVIESRLAEKITKFIDALFWIITISVSVLGVTSIVCLVLLFLPNEVMGEALEFLKYVLSLVGLAGFLSLCAYLRKLAKINQRLTDVEKDLEQLKIKTH